MDRYMAYCNETVLNLNRFVKCPRLGDHSCLENCDQGSLKFNSYIDIE